MKPLLRRGALLVGAALLSCALVTTGLELAGTRVASATTLPDVPGQPVPFGDAAYLGSMGGQQVNGPVVGMAATPDDGGYWEVGSDGGVFAFGDAASLGSMGGQHLAQPVIAITPTPDGKGYWLLASDGGVFSFGDAQFFGSTGAMRLNAPVVGMAATPDGRGYWLVASDGGVFSFGDAPFFGSMGGQHLNQPMVALVPTPRGTGYTLAASDGGVFTFGDASFFGSAGSLHLNAPVVGMAATPSGDGYWLVGADGGVFNYGGATFYGTMGGQTLQNPVAAIVATHTGHGYWLLPAVEIPSVTLKPGDQSAAVLAVQQRLSALGYWLGTPNGVFGDSTQQAVYAIQKAAGLPRTGVVGPSTDLALAQGVVPQPRSTSGYVIEVNLADDLVMFVNNGHVNLVFNTSTGGGYTYTQDGVTNVALTPQGHFQLYRQVNGLVVDSLGALWRPKFFTGGFAIHGDTFVPPEPVSHGCVRVSNEAIDWIWANNVAPLGTAVWVY
jgi:hypothetical protein